MYISTYHIILKLTLFLKLNIHIKDFFNEKLQAMPFNGLYCMLFYIFNLLII